MGLRSVHHVVSAAPSPSGGGLLTLCPCSSLMSLLRETVLHKLLQRESFPWAAALQELLQHGSLPQGAAFQEQAAPAWVPHGVTIPASKPALVWAPLSTGRQVLLGACSRVGSPLGSTGYRWISAPPWTSMDRSTGTSFFTMVFSMCCRGRLSASVSQAPPAPPSSLTLVSAGMFLSLCLAPLSRLPFSPCGFFFFPLLKHVVTEVLPPLLIGLVLASVGSVLELADTGFIRHRGSFSQLLAEPSL